QDYYDIPLLDLAKINQHSVPAANAWALCWIVLFACYYAAFRLCPASQAMSRTFRWVALAVICGWAAIFCINLVFMYPVGAADIFDNILRGRMVSHYGLNPLIALPTDVQADPLFPYTAWKNEPSHYGPLWGLAAAGVAL